MEYEENDSVFYGHYVPQWIKKNKPIQLVINDITYFGVAGDLFFINNTAFSLSLRSIKGDTVFDNFYPDYDGIEIADLPNEKI